jgi:Zn-dependent M28 family amino/carboxypeptidase
VGFIPAAHSAEHKNSIALSAHIDHLGINSTLEGDTIFNGAVDNASAVAAMMMTAKILKDNQSALHYPVVVLACEAEEAGLLGSRYFANGLAPGEVLANINFESTPVGEATRDIIAVGSRYSTLKDSLLPVLKEENLKYSDFSLVQHGWFYRSDQFSFARRGIPAIWISSGEEDLSGKNQLRAFFEGAYHTPDDEFDPDWELAATRQTVHITIRLIDYLNRVKPELRWKARLPFPVEK